MTQNFRSKIDIALLLPIALLLVAVAIFMMVNKIWPAAMFVVLIILFVAYLYANTYYQITDNRQLKVKGGFLVNKQIDISTIKKITTTRNPLAAPALSLDRLEITYNKYDTILISPKEKSAFIATLRRINPNITID